MCLYERATCLLEAQVATAVYLRLGVPLLQIVAALGRSVRRSVRLQGEAAKLRARAARSRAVVTMVLAIVTLTALVVYGALLIAISGGGRR